MPSIIRLSYTLLVSALLVLLASPSPSNALSPHEHQPHLARGAQHAAAENKRRMEKRFGNFPAVVPVNAEDQGATQPTISAPANGGQNAPTPVAGAGQNTPTTTAANNGNNGGIIGGIVGGAAASSTTASATASSVTSTALSTTSTTSTATSSALPTININTNTPTPSLPLAINTISLVATVSALPTPSVAPQSSSSSANTFGKNTIIAIAVIAGSIGGAAAIWTLIRKWKLGPSTRFEERMQPIEWSPDGAPGLPGAAREKDAMGGSLGAEKYGGSGVGRRPSSTGSAGSFHSGEANNNNLGRNVTGNGNMFAEQDVPPHDFTAGSNGGYGPGAYDYDYNAHNPQAGYVDLQRNVSGGGNLGRAPSNGAYGPGYGYDQQAYGHEDPYAQDAYGGYETQPHQQYAPDRYGNDGRAANYNQATYQGGRY